MSSNQTASLATLNYFYKLPTESLYYIFECMTEKDQLNFALTCEWIYRVFRIYHVGYALPKWFPIDITQNSDTSGNSNNELSNDELIDIKSLPIERKNVPNTPSSANYRDGVIFDGKLYIPIFEKESPICWILNFEEIPLNWKRVKITFVEFESEEDIESLNSVEDKKSENNEIETHKSNYQPLRFTVAAAISSMIYLFGGENIINGELNGTLYVLDPIKMELKKVMGQGGDIPSARKMHSLNAIGDRCLALFGGRCHMNDSNNPREYDTKDFHIYDITTKIWTIYRDPCNHIPYARCLHSTTVLEYSLYIYGGQQITSSTPESRIHDDDDLWCFTFNSTQQEDSADEGQNTPEESSTSSKGSNKSRISLSFQTDKWQKLFSPRNNTSRAFSSGIGGEWHTTTGNNVGRRCGAAMFNVGKRVAVLGGYERDNWKWNFIESENEKERMTSSITSVTSESKVSKYLTKSSDQHSEYGINQNEESGRRYQKGSDTNPWELCKLYLPDRKRWDQVKIAGFPEMECIAINQDHTNGIFVMGRKKGDPEEQGITMGWIKEEFSNI